MARKTLTVAAVQMQVGQDIEDNARRAVEKLKELARIIHKNTVALVQMVVSP